jgi:hypothetical protein
VEAVKTTADGRPRTNDHRPPTTDERRPTAENSATDHSPTDKRLRTSVVGGPWSVVV